MQLGVRPLTRLHTCSARLKGSLVLPRCPYVACNGHSAITLARWLPPQQVKLGPSSQQHSRRGKARCRGSTLSPSTVVGPFAASTTYLQLSSLAVFSSMTSGTAAGMNMSHCSLSISSIVMGSPACGENSELCMLVACRDHVHEKGVRDILPGQQLKTCGRRRALQPLFQP